MLAMAILAMAPIITVTVVLVVGTIAILLVLKWLREEPVTKQKEKIRDAVAWRGATRGMSEGLIAELTLNPEMSPQEIAEFIEQWGAGSVDEIAKKIAAQEQKEQQKEQKETDGISEATDNNE